MSDNLVNRKERHSINTLMVFSDALDKHKFEHATLYNFNKDGLSFETNDKLTPGSEIVVEITNYMPGPYGPEGSDTYTAKVKWCNPAEGSDGYVVGAEITGNVIKEKKIIGTENPCDFPFDGRQPN